MTNEYHRVPAEWEPQSAVQLTWPHAQSDWSADLEAVEATFLRIAVEISIREQLLVVCESSQAGSRVFEKITAAGGMRDNVITVEAESNDTWVRDYGPITVLSADGPRLLDFTFNGWGGKYPSELDNRMNRTLARGGIFVNQELLTVDLELEGGAVEFDGAGTLLTTRSCMLDARNESTVERDEYEARFRDLFGVSRTLWLTRGRLDGDDTDGHIDTLARFCNTTTIVYQGCDRATDSHFAELQAMALELRGFHDAAGTPYRLVGLPLPSPVRDPTGRRLPASYANFLVINGAVLAPTYGVPEDSQAIDCLQSCFPERTIVGIDCRALLLQFGSLHCLTMHYPEQVKLSPQGQ